METWSDQSVRERFRIKFYLDTNILAYLIDKTYSGLNQSIDYLNESAFADLASSRYVIFEFVGIRKREHYLREIVSKSTSATTGKVNISSLLKYKDNFLAPEVDFNSVKAQIKQKVLEELDEITNNYGIIYEKNILHDGLLAPTFDITLSSKISRHDALMYVSSIFADAQQKEEFVFIMSNDESFVKNCSENDIDGILTNHSLQKPQVEWLKSMKENNAKKLDLTISTEDVNIPNYIPIKIKELIINKNKQFYLGKTIPCGRGAGFPTDVVCFSLNPNTQLNAEIYLTIIGKDLNFIYSTKMPVSSFWNQKQISSYPFESTTETNISFKPLDNTSGQAIPVVPEIVHKLRETGNLIFINPDSIE